MWKSGSFQRVRQFRLTGGTRLQAIRSSIPEVSGPQAAVIASRSASGSAAADAVLLPRDPLNSTVTVHSTR